MKQTKRQLFFEIIRFLIVGGTATLTDYLIAYLFYRFFLPPSAIGQSASVIISTAAGFIAGLTVNWFLSVYFVFKQVSDEKKAKSGTSFIIFAVIGAVGLAVTEVGMYFGVKYLPEISLFGSTLFLGAEIKWWLCKVIMTALTLIWNYVARKLFIFK